MTQSRLYIDYVFNYNNLIFYIEYNGIQHYKETAFGSKNKSKISNNFIRQKIRDRWLRLYCKNNNIILIEIDGRKYKNDKIEKFLIKKLVPYLK